MEMRAIMALLLPCPPIPIMALNESLGQMVQSSSHDVYGICMDIAARRNDPADNRRREQDQTVCSDRLKAEMRAILADAAGASEQDFDALGHRMYEAMCAFTTAYQLSYTHLGTRTSFAYPPLGWIDEGVRMRVREWLAGREILQGKNPAATAADHAWKSVARLYCECAVLVLEFEEPRDGDEQGEKITAITKEEEGGEVLVDRSKSFLVL